jgi:hypothetical protein
MRPSKARFVTACQQLLAIGAVLAVLGPAAGVVSLDVVVTRPGAAVDAIAEQPTLTRLPGARADRRDDRPEKKSRVETATVEPAVTEVPLAAAREQEAPDATQRKAAGKREFVSAPEEVTGYGAVGVTWREGSQVGDDQITVLARTKDDGAWSDWTELEYHEEHGPDPDSDEAKHARPGTDALIVGDVDEVQTKAITDAGVEADGLEMAVIDPGRSASTEVEPAAIDTAKLDGDDEQVVPEGAELDSDQGTIELQAGSYTQKPQIYSRAQWGANESLRDASSLHYFEVHAGFVHHTVNANDYTRDEVPGIIRSIYAYHTQTRGWSDIGYNFLVDRFGRIWEGRYGGVDRPVVGAHTLDYNDYSFAMSAIGNYDIAHPSSAMIQAYGRLFAWKLSLHGVDAASTRQRVGDRYFQAINGHREAASTACPGRYLYAKIPTIRTLAAQMQADWSGRDRTTDMVGATTPDLVVRRTSDSAALVVPTDGMLRFRSGSVSRTDMDRYDVAVVSPDLSGDGKADLLVRNASTGRSGVRPGHGDGTFGGVPRTFSSFAGFEQVTPAGDLNGDGRNDVVARWPGNGQLYLFRGTSTGGFSRILLATGWSGYNLTVASGDLTGDGLADLLSRDAAGNLWLHQGDGASGLAAPTKVAGSWSGYDSIAGFGDFNADGKADLFVRSASTGSGYVVPGRGNGTFGHWIGPFGAMRGLSGINGADVTGTGGDPDLVGVRGTSLVVVAHRGTQNTLPAIGSGRKFTDTTLVLNVGDWDRDGPGDVITRSSTGTLSLYRGLGSGKFAAAVTLATGFSKVVLLSAVGDTTGDGWPDLMGQPSGGAMRIYPGRGTSGLAPSYVAYSAVTAGRQIGLGRWNSDGAPDNAFRSGDALTWLAGNGPGGLTGGRGSLSVDLGGYDWVLSLGDVDRNGRPDLVVREKTTGYLWLLPGTTTGFGTRRFLAEGFGGYDLAG